MPDTFFVGDHRQMFPLPVLSNAAPRSESLRLAQGLPQLLPLPESLTHEHFVGGPTLSPSVFMPAYPIPYVQTNYLVPDAAAHFPTAFLPTPSYAANMSSAVHHLHGLAAAATPSRLPGLPMFVHTPMQGPMAALPMPALPTAMHAMVPMMPVVGYNEFPYLSQLPMHSISGTLHETLMHHQLPSSLAILPSAPQRIAPPWCPLPDENDKSILVRATYDLPEDRVVFCNFNQLYKIDPLLYNIWLRILQRAPNAVIWLLRFPPAGEENLRRLLAGAGLSPDRIIFSNVAGKSEHVRRGCLADMCLDTMICNGHTTGMDILWSGTPMLTMPGETLASRVAASQLAALGCPELIAKSYQEYEDLAVLFATDIARLRTVQAKVRMQRSTAPLFNTRLLVSNLERAYKVMYNHFLSGKGKAHLYVDK